ncbi:MAG: nuclear transport factor 2 family protein [Cytophagales bacterium]|nr:nuclear transport factor 2 family protein [Cytophagales bacterium]
MDHQFTEREQIAETVSKLFVFTDNQEWIKLREEVFTSDIELDMVSMGAEKPEIVSSREICYRWEKAFAELDAIHHQAGNYLVNVRDNQAEVYAYSIASHYKEAARKGKTREFVGSYDLHLMKTTAGWRIDKFKYNLKYSTGNMTLE